MTLEQVGEPLMVVGVPGPWASMAEFQAARGAADTPDLQSEFYRSDPELHNAFRVASGGRLSEEELLRIRSHKGTIYYLSFRRGEGAVSALVDAGMEALAAGGFAVKIESTGVAFSAQAWTRLAKSEVRRLHYHEYFVVYLRGEQTLRSCGMHSFGLPEAGTAFSPLEKAQGVLSTFNRYQLFEAPSLREGETFSESPHHPMFLVSHADDSLYSPGELFHNPFGVWWLAHVQG